MNAQRTISNLMSPRDHKVASIGRYGTNQITVELCGDTPGSRKIVTPIHTHLKDQSEKRRLVSQPAVNSYGSCERRVQLNQSRGAAQQPIRTLGNRDLL
jgi:hypothetical protein